MKKVTDYLLFAGLILCLLQVWLPAYFLTGDGPSHLYNAQVLHDLWCHKNTAFYSDFYKVVYRPDPNWLTTFVLAALLFAAKGVVAEKIFITAYILLFTGGFYALLKRISTNPYWPLVLLLFVFPHTLFKGFYNSSFSIAFYFWMVWGWLRFLDRKNIVNAALFFAFTALIFFTHLLAFLFGAFTCAALILSYTIAATDMKGRFAIFFLKYAGWLLLFLAPFMALAAGFTQKEGGIRLQLHHHFYRLVELVQFKYFVDITHKEDLFAEICGILLLLLSLVSFLFLVKSRKVNKYDGFVLSLVMVLFVYLFFPEAFMGRLILISMRVQPFVFILLVCCIAYRFPTRLEKVRDAGSFILFGCFICLGAVRLQCQLKAGNAAMDYLSVSKYIKPNTTVLPLDFSPGGADAAGHDIADANWLFVHTAQYLGTEKPLIVLDNYEANMGYFPVNWVERTNPYSHLGKAEGMEGTPPYADIEGYKKATGVNVDYIIMWCYDPIYLQNGHFSKLYAEIQAGYHIVSVSPSKKAVLYALNSMAE